MGTLKWGIGETIDDAAKDAGIQAGTKLKEVERPNRVRAEKALPEVEADANGAVLAMRGSYREVRDLKRERELTHSRGKGWIFKRG